MNNNNNCFKCLKKLGYYGFKCRCNNDFCNNHKLPENHECNFKFQFDLKFEKIKNKKIEDF